MEMTDLDTLIDAFQSLLFFQDPSCTPRPECFNQPKPTDVISTFAAFFTLLSVFAALVVGVMTIRANRNQSRVNASLEFEKSLNHDPMFVDTRKQALTPLGKVIRSLANEEKQCGACHYLKQSDANIAQLDMFLNEWERVGNGIFFKAYDGDLLYGTYGSTIIQILNRCAPHIIKSQERNPRTFIRFTQLAVEWSVRRSKENGDRVPEELRLCLMYLRIHHQMVYGSGIYAFLVRIFAFTHYGNNMDMLLQSRKFLALYFTNHVCLLPNDKPIPPHIDMSKAIEIKNIDVKPFKKLRVKLVRS